MLVTLFRFLYILKLNKNKSNIKNTMNESNSKEITIHDFNNICRVCLQVGKDMIDIFSSGIENRIMEVTNLRVEQHDELPKSICQKCNNQMFQLFLFLEQAKSSDFYLRSVLSNKEISFPEGGFKMTQIETNEKTTHKKSIKKCCKKSNLIKKVRNELESDKMYLIYVPEDDGDKSKLDKEICIKELNSGSDNLGLTNFCRTLVKSYFSDHTYPKEQKNAGDIQIFNNNYFLQLEQESSKTYAVNLDIYKCSECKKSYEEFDELKAHFINHDKQPSFLKSNFSCPVCEFSAEENLIFLNHLKSHKEEGFFFIKVNASGEIMPLKENEKDLFTESFKKDCRIFSLNINSLKCTICSENIQSGNNISEHLEKCLLKEKSQIKFKIKYLCPICFQLFIDDKETFLQHLSCHKKENFFFIKVDSAGEPVKLEEDDQLYIPFEEATKLFEEKNTVFEIIDLNSCDKCNFTSETFNKICEHYDIVHSEKMSTEISFNCPVCLADFSCGIVDEIQTKFYEHLKAHKSNGKSFILVKRNGVIAEVKQKHLDIFSQSLFLWYFINSSALMIQNISPELIILDEKNSSEKYTCDLCKKQFNKKQEVIKHLKSHQFQEVMLPGKLKYICEKCGKKCSGKLSYKKHFLKHSKSFSSIGRRSLCTICNKTFANKTTLSGHMKHHIKEGKGNELSASLLGIMCEKCGKTFASNASLTKHKKIHLKEKEKIVQKCEICDREFFSQPTFDRHISAHLNPKYLECEVCRFPLSSVASLQKHSEIHRMGSNTYDCKACKLSFLTKDSLTAHQTHTGHYLDRKPLECNVCHEKFFIGRKFSEHIKTHPKYKMGECTLCGKRLSTIQSLMIHMGRHFESNSILCPHCGKQFSEERNYHRHLLTHEGIKPFPCDTEGCKKAFYTLFELNRHKKYHNNTRDFRCPHCLKSFHEANHLTVHIRIHTGERPYTCPHCNKGFVTRTHCKHHIKLMHQGVGYDLIKSNISKKVTVFEAVEAIV